MIDKDELYSRSEAGLTFTKAKASQDSGACLEVAPHADGSVSLRDSKRPEMASLRLTPEEWAAFKDGVRNNEFGA